MDAAGIASNLMLPAIEQGYRMNARSLSHRSAPPWTWRRASCLLAMLVPTLACAELDGDAVVWRLEFERQASPAHEGPPDARWRLWAGQGRSAFAIGVDQPVANGEGLRMGGTPAAPALVIGARWQLTSQASVSFDVSAARLVDPRPWEEEHHPRGRFRLQWRSATAADDPTNPRRWSHLLRFELEEGGSLALKPRRRGLALTYRAEF